jgi:hypothetical protein
MSGITLLSTSFTSLAQEQASATFLQRSTASGTTTQMSLATEMSIHTDLRTTVTSLDPQSAAAIVGSVTGAIGISPGSQSSTLATVFDQLGKTMAQGQGAYFVGFSTRAGSVFMSMTPDAFAQLMAGKGPEPIGGHSLSDALKQAMQQAQGNADPAPPAAPTEGDPALNGARAALAMLRRNNAASPGTLAVPAETNNAPSIVIGYLARQIGGMVNMTLNPNGTARTMLSVVYVPPAEASTTDIQTTQTASTDTVATLNITA